MEQTDKLAQKKTCICQPLLQEYFEADGDRQLELEGKILAFFELVEVTMTGLYVYQCRNCGYSFCTQERLGEV